MAETKRACEGADTRNVKMGDGMDGEQCRECANAIAWDFTEHPFFGFKATCPMKSSKKAVAS